MSQDFVIEGAVLSYPHIFQPSVAQGASEARFGASLILPENYDWTQCQQALQEAISAQWPQGAPNNLRMPFDQVSDGVYAGRFQLKAYSKADKPPQVVMQNPAVKAGPHQAGEFFPGCIVNAYVRAFGYQQGGVSLNLNAIQLVSNDANLPRLDSQRAATEVFQTVPGGPAPTAGVPGNGAQFPGAGQPMGQPAPGPGPGMMPAGMPSQAVPNAAPATQAPAGMPPGVPGAGVPTGAPTVAPAGAPAGQPPAGMPWNQ